ncbi:MAG: hypothetical protein H6907_09540 [Hyphomicrobiales bacterium]|nr:hypothetical protein [Hyphomicrobiales bacterium]
MTSGTDARLWRDFAAWCVARRLRPLPAHPWTVAAFLRWRATRRRKDPHDAALQAIARAHLLRGLRAPDRHPTVTRTLEVVERQHRERGRRAALFDPADARAAAAADEAAAEAPPPAAKRKGAAKGRRALRTAPRLVPPPTAPRARKAGK